MAKNDRTGVRKTREQSRKFKVPELGYYLIVTDTEATERCFFTGLHQALPDEVKNKIVIKVVETKTCKMIDKCLELTAYDAQYRIPWIVFDRDQVKEFDSIIAEAVRKGIKVGWSNPCFEIWLYAYFGEMPAIQESWICNDKFGQAYEKQTGQKYSKADEQMYQKLCKFGDEEQAIKIATQKLEQCKREGRVKPSEMCPCTTVHELVGEIRGKGAKEVMKEQKPFEERHPKLNFLIGLLLLIGITIVMLLGIKWIMEMLGEGVVRVVEFIKKFVNTSDKVIVVAMITGAVSITGVVISSIIAKVVEYRFNVKKYLYDKREEPYKQFVEIIYEIRKDVGLGRKLRKGDMLSFFVNDIENLK